jgi:hypothetical protein
MLLDGNKEVERMTLKEFRELKKEHCIHDDVDDVFSFVSELLHKMAREIEKSEPYATRTINDMDRAACEVYNLIDYVSELEEG